MTHLFSQRSTIILWIFTPLLLSSACQAGAETQSSPADSQTLEVISVQGEVVFGPGSFNFLQPTSGLSDFTSYKATLSLSFDGTEAGNTTQWSRTYVMLAAQEPPARWLTIENSGDLPDLDAVFMAEVNGATYERRGENACHATVIDQGNSLGEWWEPAGFLSGVIGAEEAGIETVNNVAADHYTFDERALGLLGLAHSTGEMWVASEGGYLVKYILTTQGNANYFGEGIEGTLTWDYVLTEVSQPVTIELPADCPAGMVDAPQLPDASNVLNMPAVLAYDTSSSLADAAAFYQERLPTLGWQPLGEPAIAETTALQDFTKGDQTMTVIITAGDSATTIRIVIARTQ